MKNNFSNFSDIFWGLLIFLLFGIFALSIYKYIRFHIAQKKRDSSSSSSYSCFTKILCVVWKHNILHHKSDPSWKLWNVFNSVCYMLCRRGMQKGNFVVWDSRTTTTQPYRFFSLCNMTKGIFLYFLLSFQLILGLLGKIVMVSPCVHEKQSENGGGTGKVYFLLFPFVSL